MVIENPLADDTSALPVQITEMRAIYLEQIAGQAAVINRLADDLEGAL